MTTSELTDERVFPPAIVDAVRASVEKTYSAFCGETPVAVTNGPDCHDGPCIAGIISFFGEVPWSLSWVLSRETAPLLAQRFCGFEIPFDSPDMGDMAGELVNVLAGEVVSQLEQRRIKAQMSLPTVARGSPLELMSERSSSVSRLDFTSSQGAFSIRLAAARAGQIIGRTPGK